MKKIDNKMFDDICDEIALFFGIEVNDLKIDVAENRCEFDKISGKKSESWVNGRTYKPKTIVVLDPNC